MEKILDTLAQNDWLYLFIGLATLVIVLIIAIIILIVKTNKKGNKVEVIENTIEEEENNDISELLNKMQEDIEKKDNDHVLTFEKEQEEQAIISYQELLKANQQKEVNDEEIDPLEEPKKFKSSEFISPIYGTKKNSLDLPKEEPKEEPKVNQQEEFNEELNEINKKITGLDAAIKKNQNFLEELKSFRNNL